MDGAVNKLPQSLNHSDAGSMAKKKKEIENRTNSMSSDMPMDWSQRDTWVIVTLVTGNNHDSKRIKVEVEPNYVSITLSDGRRYATKLYSEVVVEGAEYHQKGHQYIVKLMKHDPTIHWPTLMPSTTSNKNHNNNNVSQNNNYNNNNSSNNNRRPSSSKVNEAADSSNKQSINNCNKKMESAGANATRITLQDVKMDYCEWGDVFMLHIFLKKIKKETLHIKFLPNKIIILFNTADPKILSTNQSYSESTTFEYHRTLLGSIVPDECTHVLSACKLEVKLKKEKLGNWQAISPIDGAKGASCSAIVAEASGCVPPAPPAPPTPIQARKPTCLVSPSPSGARHDRFSISSGSAYNTMSSSGYGSPPAKHGYMGLENIGNTCFMNSVLQTLLNTRELRDYFLSPVNYSQKELNTKNPLGQGGRLAVAFALLMKVAWNNQNRSFAPAKLKAVMSLKANQFSGFAQHDAQEFMVELLDGLHEDLNRIKQKPYFAEPPELDGWDDAMAANESWRLHKLRNDSIIDDLFKGQFRSALTCHECNKISVKFDEFCCLSVPIPKDQKVLKVVFFYRDTYKRPIRVSVSISADAVLEDFKRELGTLLKISPSCIVLLETFKHKVQKLFQRGASLASVICDDNLLAFEVITPAQVGEDVLEVCITQRLTTPTKPIKCAHCDKLGSASLQIKRCTKCLNVGYCSTDCQKAHWQQHNIHCHFTHEVVGYPFIVSLPKSHATYNALSRAMENYARHSVDFFQPPVQQLAIKKRLATDNRSKNTRKGSTSSNEMSPDEDQEKMEVDVTMVERLSCSSDTEACSKEEEEEEEDNNRPNTVNNDWGTGHLLTAPNTHNNNNASGSVCAVQPLVPYPNTATQLFTIIPVSSRGQTLPNQKRVEDEGDEPLDLDHHQYYAMDWTNSSSTNEAICLIKNKEIDCDEGPRSAGILNDGSSLYSPHQVTTLQSCMDLFTQPENLYEGDSWRCPRCKKPVEATKQMSLWKLPPVLIVQLKRFSFKYVLYSDKIDKFVQYPIRGFDVSPYISPGGGDGRSTQYDLYGVVNHMGRLLGGHYTAYARTLNAHDTDFAIDWRLFDDSRVSNIREENVVNDQAYLLLYRRRGTPFTLPDLPAPEEEEPEMPQETASMETASAGASSVSIDNCEQRNVVYQSNNVSTVHVPVSAPSIKVVHNSNLSQAFQGYASSGMSEAYDNINNSPPQHSNLLNMRIGQEETLYSTEQGSTLSAFDSLLQSPLTDSYKATSTINTKDAMCGNLVSNIHIEDGAVGGSLTEESAVGGAAGDSFSSMTGNTNITVAPFYSSAINASDIFSAPTASSSYFSPIFGASSNSFSNSGGASCVPRAPAVGAECPVVIEGQQEGSNSTGISMSDDGGGSIYVDGGSASAVASSPSDVVLDAVTPMSVSTTSQPSVSSTEEESISTPQEELD
uniref:ubiquitinyl hydrolase 1 n=2 Tax=Hirondellea gigas TaxID=1518452 RepID=A0A6A7FSR5_9CRUS